MPATTTPAPTRAPGNEELFFFPHDGGFLSTPQNPDGSFGNGTLNAPPLIEAADTGPFFRTATTVSVSCADAAIQRQMLRLALIDMQEALVVLGAIPGRDPDAVEKIGVSTQLIQNASTTDSIDDRRLDIFHAINFGSAGAALIGANLTFQIDEGTVMF